MEAMGALPSFAGVAVHDAWAPYHIYIGAGHPLRVPMADVLAAAEPLTSAFRLATFTA